MFSYKILENNLVEIYDSNRSDPSIPTIIQPRWPDGQEWASKEEAEQWAMLYVESSNNSSSELLAGFNPENPTRPRPEPEEEAPAE